MIKVTRGGRPLNKVSVIKTKPTFLLSEWVFVALDGNAPRLIFPRRFLDLNSLDLSDNIVSFDFVYEFNKKKIVVELRDPIEANKFRLFIEFPQMK